MYVLTLKQPWASAIIFGPKRVENRTWRSPDKLIGQTIAIHAGKSLDTAGRAVYEAILRTLSFADWKPLRWHADHPMGCILGTARLVRVVTAMDDPWFFGPFGWVVEDVRPVTPYPCAGHQGIWVIPDDVLTVTP